jgi:alpha-tubulin suppressor-like RCC1 family protein
VALSDYSACALLDDSTVKCWGYNANGELALGDKSRRGAEPQQMGKALPFFTPPTGRTIKGLSVQSSVPSGFCALLDDSSVRCFGTNLNGQLGYGDKQARGGLPAHTGDGALAVDLGLGRSVQSIARGDKHACAILADAQVKCWGHNAEGQLGLGDTSDRGVAPGQMGESLPSVNLGTGRTAKAVVVGSAHSCALLDNASVKCWGSGYLGRLGNGSAADIGVSPGQMGDALPPINLGMGRTVKQISAGSAHTCAVLDDDTVKCWGQNSSGRLGSGTTAHLGDAIAEMGDGLKPVNLGVGVKVKLVVAGSTGNCALTTTGALKCWGENGSGQLGLGDLVDRGAKPADLGDELPAVNLGKGRTVRSVALGGDSRCALLDNRSIKCWGYNNQGQLGLGDLTVRGSLPTNMGDNLPSPQLR